MVHLDRRMDGLKYFYLELLFPIAYFYGTFVPNKYTYMHKTIFITGTSSGLGRLTALYFADRGWKVAATMRSPEKETELGKHENIRVFRLDVTDPGQVKAAI